MKYFLLSFDVLEKYWVDAEVDGKVNRTYGWMRKEHTSRLVEADSYEWAVQKLKNHFKDLKIANIENATL